MNLRSIAIMTVFVAAAWFPADADAGLYPGAPGVGDPLFVHYGSLCGMSIADTSRPAQVAYLRDNEAWHVRVTAYLIAPVSEICAGIGPPRTHAVPLGPAPEGMRYVYVDVEVITIDRITGDVKSTDTWTDARGLRSTPDQSISGMWLSPDAPGELTHVTYAEYIGGDGASVFVTTQLFDAQGRLAPFTAVGRFEDMHFLGSALTASRPDASATGVEPSVAGDLHLDYQGCNRATLRFESRAEDAIPSSERVIHRIVAPEGADTCSSFWEAVDVEIVAWERH